MGVATSKGFGAAIQSRARLWEEALDSAGFTIAGEAVGGQQEEVEAGVHSYERAVDSQLIGAHGCGGRWISSV